MRRLARSSRVFGYFWRLGPMGALGLVAGCTPSIALRGGTVVARGEEPDGEVLASYRPVGCVDEKGQPAPVQRGKIWLVRVDDAVRLVETAAGRDSLVVTNSFVSRGERVFQLSTNSLPEPVLWAPSQKDDLLFDYRLPENGQGDGRFGLVQTWREERGEGGSVRAYFDHVVLACRLTPVVPRPESE